MDEIESSCNSLPIRIGSIRGFVDNRKMTTDLSHLARNVPSRHRVRLAVFVVLDLPDIHVSPPIM